MPVTDGRFGYIWLLLTLVLLWLLIGEYPELAWEETEAGVSTGVSSGADVLGRDTPLKALSPLAPPALV